ILTRRDALRVAAFSGFGLILGGTKAEAAAAPVLDLVATPELTEGPFFVDNKLNRKNVTEGTTRKTVVDGAPLKLKIKVFKIVDGKTTPLENAQVDIWHTDASGIYSGEPKSFLQAEDTSGQMWLRGFQKTDKNGECEIDTIFPGYYRGRTNHIHFKIRLYSKSGDKTYDFSSQWFFDEATNDQFAGKDAYVKRTISNANDGIFSAKQADGTAVGSHLMLKTKELKKGLEASFSVGLVLK
ncbi:MAG: twin-arginine translocation pathway signal protein, partial [Fimbriimonadaceae bacterium]